ncbi:MAG: chemotaxis protein CheW [Pseudomonadota bacterium]
MSSADSVTASPVKADAAGRRTRLRQYQVQLLERMQAARGDSGARVNQLGVTVGSRRFLLELGEAGEIVPVGAITAVPLAQPWFLGLSNIRGNLIGIIDLACYNGEPNTVTGPDSRIITFAAGLGFNCGLLVSRVHGLRYAGDMTAAGERLRDAESNEWTLMDLAALVREPRFLHVGL